MAHDWGGGVAWSFAALHPELLSNLVLNPLKINLEITIFYLEPDQIILNLPHLLALMESRGKTWEQALKSWYIIFFQVGFITQFELG